MTTHTAQMRARRIALSRHRFRAEHFLDRASRRNPPLLFFLFLVLQRHLDNKLIFNRIAKLEEMRDFYIIEDYLKLFKQEIKKIDTVGVLKTINFVVKFASFLMGVMFVYAGLSEMIIFR